MKKSVLLLAVLLTVTMVIPAAYAGKNNTVSSEWYYNDPDGSAYRGGTNDPQYPYTRMPSGELFYTPTSQTPPRPGYSSGSSGGSSSSSGSVGNRTLKKTSPYMRGSDVRTLQIMLNNLGYFAGKVDGIFGSNTRAAVIRFQRHNGLTADGVVGPVTRARLLKVYKQRYGN